MTFTSKHYETAFEALLQQSQLPYIPLSQVKKASFHGQKLKSFDYIIHPDKKNALLVDIKGRKLDYKTYSMGRPGQNWVTIDDVSSMLQWQENFGPGHDSVFIFAYWLHDFPDQTNINNDIFIFNKRHYWLIAIYVLDYKTVMKNRSKLWKTVDLPAKKFRLLCKTFNQIL